LQKYYFFGEAFSTNDGKDHRHRGRWSDPIFMWIVLVVLFALVLFNFLPNEVLNEAGRQTTEQQPAVSEQNFQL
jgi:hypothetical protein